jgi:RND superfamily putative drug exporter
MLASLARVCYNRRRYVLAGWLVASVLISFVSKVAGGKETTNFSVPGTESQQAIDLLKARFPARSGDTPDIVFAAPGPGGVDAVRSRIDAAVSAARAANRHISGVVSPFDAQGGQQISPDRHVAFAEIRLDTRSDTLPTRAGSSIKATVVAAATGPGLQLSFAGALFKSSTPPGATEAIGLLAAMIILLMAFGSLLAMAMPVFIAIFSIVIGLALVALLANVIEINSATGFITAMIGIGVGIDYALFSTI